jgi:hypothetical protein
MSGYLYGMMPCYLYDISDFLCDFCGGGERPSAVILTACFLVPPASIPFQISLRASFQFSLLLSFQFCLQASFQLCLLASVPFWRLLYPYIMFGVSFLLPTSFLPATHHPSLFFSSACCPYLSYRYSSACRPPYRLLHRLPTNLPAAIIAALSACCHTHSCSACH